MTGKCQYCAIFQSISRKRWQENGTKRFCKRKGLIEGESKGCTHFVLAKYFFCLKYTRRIPFAACVNRQLHPHPYKVIHKECKKCNQGREILELLRGHRAPLNGKPRLIIRRKNEDKQSPDAATGHQSSGDCSMPIKLSPGGGV